jgi:formyl-CoA transferase
MALPLEGIKVIDFTGVQAGPACTQLLAWFGADVLKVERPGVGDVTRRQLRDIADLDALYFITLNSNKKSLTLNTKTPEGKAILEKLIREADVLVENFAPGAMDRMGFTWEHIQELNPRIIFGSIKGFSEGSPYEDLKVYDNVAQCAGGAASTTGFWDGPPTVSGAALGDSNTGMHLAIGILTALIGRAKTGKGQKVAVSMQDAVLNLCRVKLRDQERLDHVGYLEEYPQYPNGKFGDAVPRGGNAGGGGSRAGYSSARAGKPIRTPTSISRSRSRIGSGPARPSASRNGRMILPTPPLKRGSPRSSISLPKLRNGWLTRPSSTRSKFCASSTCHADRFYR